MAVKHRHHHLHHKRKAVHHKKKSVMHKLHQMVKKHAHAGTKPHKHDFTAITGKHHGVNPHTKIIKGTPDEKNVYS